MCAANFCGNLCRRSARDLSVLSANRRLRAACGGLVCGVVYGEIPERDARFSGGQHALGAACDGVLHNVVGPVSTFQREGVIFSDLSVSVVQSGIASHFCPRGFRALQWDGGELAVERGGFLFVTLFVERVSLLQDFRGGSDPF